MLLFLCLSKSATFSILGSIPKSSIPYLNLEEGDLFLPFKNGKKTADVVFAEESLQLKVKNSMKRDCTVETEFPAYHLYRNIVKGGFSVSFSQKLYGSSSLVKCILSTTTTISFNEDTNSDYIFTNEKTDFENFTEILISESPFAFILDKNVCPYRISVFSRKSGNKVSKRICKGYSPHKNVPFIIAFLILFSVILYYYSRHSIPVNKDAKVWVFDRKLNLVKGGDYKTLDDFTRLFVEDTQRCAIKYNKPVIHVIKMIRNNDKRAFVRVGSFPTTNAIVSACWTESFGNSDDVKYKLQYESKTHKLIDPPKMSFISYRSYLPFRITYTIDNMIRCTADIPSVAILPFQPHGQLSFVILSIFYSAIKRIRDGCKESLDIGGFCKECISTVKGRRIIIFCGDEVICNIVGENATGVEVEQFWKLAEKTKPFESHVWKGIISQETKVFVNKTVGSANELTTVIEYPIDSPADIFDDSMCPFLSFCILFLFHMKYANEQEKEFENFEKVFEKEDQSMFIEFLENKGTILGNSISTLEHVSTYEELVTIVELKGYSEVANMFRKIKEVMKTKEILTRNVLVNKESNVWFTVYVTKEYDSVNNDMVISVAAERINKEKIEEIEAMKTLCSICEQEQDLIYQFHTDSDEHIIMDNDRLFKFLGVESCNRDITDIIYGADKKKIKQSGSMRRIPVRLNSNRGEIWFSIAKLKDIGFMMCTDKFQEVNYQSFDDFHVGGSTSAVTFWIVNISKDQVQPLFMQPTIWDIIGVPPDTQFSKLISYLHPDDREAFSIGYSDLISRRKIQYLSDVRILKPGDAYKWYKLSFAISKNDILHCLAMNINKKRKVESNLKETKEFRNLLLSSGKLALWKFSDDNKVMKRPKGLEEGVIVNLNMNWNFISTYIPESYRERVTNEIRKGLETGSTIEFYAPITMENDQVMWVSVRGKGDTIRGKAVGVGIDITDLRNAFNRLDIERQKAEEASRQKTLFLTNMSHEIRTPMNGIFGMLDVLSLQDLTSEQRLLVDSIRSSSFQLMNLLNDTLHLSKIEQGETELHRSIFNIWQMIEPTIIANYTKAKENGVNFYLDVKVPFPITVNADPQLFMKILNNLLSNAIKFTKQGHIGVKMRIENDVLFLDVSDTGIGISKDQQAVIFERFVQADTCVARFFGGSGLGLSLVQEISKFLGGEVNVESEVGKGSTFSVKLPIETCYYPFIPVLKKPKKIIIRIDDERTKKPIVDWCEYFHFNVLQVTTPEEFHKSIDSDTIALFIENGAKNQKMFKDVANRVGSVRVCAITDTGEACIFKYCIPRPVMFHHIMKFINSINSGDKEGPNVQTTISTSKHILVAEDNKTNQKVMKKILEGLHCTYSIAENGKEAIDQLDKEEFDFVFMDCQMPVLDGLDATRIIRSSEKPYSKIPIVALTAGAVEGSEEACLNAGMDSYLAKPVRIQQITEVIRRFSQL